jgi:hypothetical protein
LHCGCECKKRADQQAGSDERKSKIAILHWVLESLNQIIGCKTHYSLQNSLQAAKFEGKKAL